MSLNDSMNKPHYQSEKRVPNNIKKNLRVTVYALSSSLKKNTVCYIGQTSVALEKRLAGHLSASATRRTPVALWIRKEMSKGHKILIQTLEKNALRHQSEKKWIALFSGSGAKLLNCNAGGGGGMPSCPTVPGRGPAAKGALAPAALWPFPTSSRP
jgi:hypothetical protein